MSKVPVNLQFELALLWRTLSIIKNIDGLSVVDFYEKFLPTVKAMPNLSLSTYWEEVSNVLVAQNESNVSQLRSVVGVPTIEAVSTQDGATETKKSDNHLMSIPELDYLKHDDRIDHKHDPLQVIQNIYGAAAAYAVDASPYNQSILFSACLAIAVKSGRASLLLHLASMISTMISNSGDPEAPYISIDLDPLNDVVNLLSHKTLPAVPQPAHSTNKNKSESKENEVLRYEKDPLLANSTVEDRGRGDSVGNGRRGMILSFGKADHGKLGHGDVQLHRLVPTVIESLQEVEIRKTASMSTYSVAIDTQGSVYVWGTGGSAGAIQSTKADIQPQLLEALPLQAKVIDVSCGLGHALFLLHTGRVYSWGNGGNGRLGLGDLQDRTEACPVMLLQHETIAAVQCGASHSMALTTAGKVYSWGKNTQGQCGHGNAEDQLKPAAIRKLDDQVVTQLAAGWEHSLALTREGTMYSWGSGYKDNRRGVVPPVLGLGHNEARQSPELIASIETVKIINIHCGWDHCLAVDEHGKLLAWGSGQNGKLGLGTEENVSIPCYVSTLGDDEEAKGTDKSDPKNPKADVKTAKSESKKRIFVTHLSAGCEHTAVLTRDGEVYAWGHGDGGRLGHGNNAQCFVPTKVESIGMMGIKPTNIHCGDKFTMILAHAAAPTPASTLNASTLNASTDASAQAAAALGGEKSAYFADTKVFLRENVLSSDTTDDEGSNKLNLQTLESTQILKSLLALMASASLPRADPVSTPSGGIDTNADVTNIMALVARFTAHSVPRALSPSATTSGAASTGFTTKEQVATRRGLDREYSVECADSTYTNLLQIFDALFVSFQSALSGFVGSSGEASSSHIISAQFSSMSLLSSAEERASPVSDLLQSNNNASFGNLSHMGDAKQPAGQDAQSIADQFESLYCVLIIFAANMEVFAERCQDVNKLVKEKSDDTFHLRAKDWRNIQRELSRMVHISLEENPGGELSARSERSHRHRRHSQGRDEDPDDDEDIHGDADGDAEYSLGSIESEERRLLQSMVRQHQLHQEFHGTDQRHHHHQQDQQSDDENEHNRDYHEDNSAYEGEERDFGADSGDDSFFSGDRSRMRAGTDYDDEDQRRISDFRAYSGAEDEHTFNTGGVSPLSGAQSHLVPVQTSARRHPTDRVESHSRGSSRAGEWERERERDHDHPPYGSRANSPALSFDSLTHPVEGEHYDRAETHEHEDGYFSENSFSDSQDSRYERRSNQRGTSGQKREEEEDDGDMERYYEEQAQEMENLDLQRAIISSMQSNPTPYETVAHRGTALMYDGKPGRFGEGIGLSTADSQPAIPRIRDVLNSLASRCYLALEAMHRNTNTGASTVSVPKSSKVVPQTVSVSPADRAAVNSVYLLWEAAQIVTNTGYEVLYSEQDQRTVLTQLIRSPSLFMYIIPGIVDGASRTNKLYASLAALLPPNESFFTASGASSSAHNSEEGLDFSSILAFLSFVNLQIRASNDVPSKPAQRTSEKHAAPGVPAAVPNSVEHCSVRMYSSISTALVTLTKHLLKVVLDRIEQSASFLNDTIGCKPEAPWGPEVAKLFESVADCALSDLEVLTSKVGGLDDTTEARYHNSFTNSVVGFFCSRVMAKTGVVQAVALLPTSIRLLRLFQGNYDAFKRQSECKERFNVWLMGCFQWVVYHLTSVVNLVLHPPRELSPPRLRAAAQACKELLSAADVRKVLLGANSSNTVYTWEQTVWSALSRADPSLTRNNSNVPTESTAATITDVRGGVVASVDVHLLVLSAYVGENIPVSDLSRTIFHSAESKFVDTVVSELVRFFSTPSDQYKQKLKHGEECMWTTFSPVVQFYLAVLHSLCNSASLNLPNLVTQVLQVEAVGSHKGTSPAKTVNSALLIASAELTTFVSLVFTSLTLTASVVETAAESQYVTNKTAFLKSVVTHAKELAGSGLSIAGSAAFIPAAALKEAAADRVDSVLAMGNKWATLVQAHLLPVKAALKAALVVSEFWVDASVHTQLTLKLRNDSVVSVPVPAANTTVLSRLAVFLTTRNLKLSSLAQLCLWDEDCLRNRQFALSMLVFLSESLQSCPEVMHYCAEGLQSFADPLEALENLNYALTHSEVGGVSGVSSVRGVADSSASTQPRAKVLNSAALSTQHRVEQLLSKLDMQLVAKITALPSNAMSPSRKEESSRDNRAVVGFGQPTLKQIPDLLTFVRHGMIANAQFGLDSQSSADSSASVVVPVSLGPFNTALKKTADAIVTLLATRKPEDHGGMSLQDVLGANKFMNLLQATLGGLASMQSIDAQQKSQAATSVRPTGPEKNHDKSAYLHALCGVLSPLGNLMKVLLTCFQQHLLFCQTVGVQFLYPSIKAIDHSSPTILPNVFTPQGNYTLGFWLYLPPIEVLLPSNDDVSVKSAPVKHRIHVMSRIFEIGEINLVSLLGSDAAEAGSFSLSVHIVIEDVAPQAPLVGAPASASAKTMYLEITIAAVDYTSSTRENLNLSANARTRSVRKASIKSKPLTSLEWTCCVVELVQDSVPLPMESNTALSSAVGAAAKAQARRQYKTKYVDSTSVALFVNNELQSATTLSGGRSALYQSMVIGKIPSKLGVVAGEKDQIFLTDVFWVPTSVYLSAAGSEYAKMRAFLTKIGSQELIYMPKSDDSANFARNDYYRNLLPSSPPSLLLETIDNAFQSSSQLLELLTTHLRAAVPTSSPVVTGLSTKAPEQAMPLNLIPTVCTFAADVICIADARAQESAFQALGALLESLPPSVIPADSSQLDLKAALSTSSPAGSAFNAAVQNKASLSVKQAVVFCVSLLEDLLHTTQGGESKASGNELFEFTFLTESPLAVKPTSNRDVWQKRLKFGRVSIERCLRVSEWGTRITLDENLMAFGVASLLALAVRNGLGDAKFQRDCGLFAMLLSGGGWAPSVTVGKVAQLTPRRLFLHYDPRAYEQCAFPSTANIAGGTSNRPGVWLGQCVGSYQRADGVSALMPLIPRTLRAATLSTEMICTRDPFSVLSMAQLSAVLETYTLKSADELVSILKRMVAPADTAPGRIATKAKPSHARALLTQFETASDNNLGTASAEERKVAEDAQLELTRKADQNYLDLMQEMAFLRLLTVQLTHATHANLKEKSEAENAYLQSQLHTLRHTVLKNMDKLLTIAVQDPVQAVSAIFNTGTFKGVQLDVLKNLLKEGDISFLEKISLRLWKQYKLDINPSCESGFGTASVPANLVQLTSLAGEVIISETKIRAQAHFPSVRLQGVTIERSTGRWFYECTLLSDGLIQIGWANAMFRCDPVCGQGVGDHTHSWAFDGLRCKKWNVSCEPYGRRWKLGDTVGALIDMDLLEIRFYLNGEDLGQAFEDFSGHDVFPALSLNVRQCVRINFGQYKFLHPPDELDGKAFRPVIAALQLQKPVVVKQPASAAKAKVSTGVSFGMKSPSGDTGGEDSAERIAAGGVTPVMSRSVLGTGSTESLLGAQVAAVMTPIRQALTSNMNTPAGAETPSTQMLTPAQTPSLGPSGSTHLISIAEGTTAELHVGFSTPTRLTPNETATTVVAAASNNENQREHQENETAAQLQILAWNAEQRRLAEARARMVREGGYISHTGERDAEDDDMGEDEDAEDDAEGLERELQREIEERERELLEEHDYERDEDREEDDDDDEDEDDDDLDAEDELRERNRDGDDLDDEAEEVNNHLHELRRQAMIENLVNMGLPEEWAIRAAQQTEVSASETAAITWIIERMELEQNGGGAGGIAQEDEEFEDAEQDLDYFMNRNPAAFRLQRSGSENSGTSGPAGGMASTTHSQRLMNMQRGVNPTDANSSTVSGGLSGLGSGSGVSPGGSPVREEIFGLRRNRASELSEDDAVSRSTAKSNLSTKVTVRGMSALSGAGGAESQLLDEISGATPWNADLSAPPVLIGQYVARRRHDQDKQEVLAQVVELDQADMLPIIIACEFSLCIYYARAVLLRSVAFVDNQSLVSGVNFDSVAKSVAESRRAGSESAVTASAQTQLATQSWSMNHLGMPVLSSLLMHSSAEPLVVVEMFKICFKQHVVGLTQPDRLFPLVANGNVLGEARDRVPTISPFTSANMCKLSSTLARLELQLFKGSEGTLAVDESSMQGLDTLSQMLDVAVYYSQGVSLSSAPADASPLSITSNLRELQSQLLRNLGVSVDLDDIPWVDKFAAGCKVTLYNLVQEALDCLQAATSPKYDTFDWISLSLDRHEKPADSNTPAGFKADAASLLSQQQENAPAVAYAFWLLRSVLTKSELYNQHCKSVPAHNKAQTTDSATQEGKTGANEFSPNRTKGSPGGRAGASTAMLPTMSTIDYLTSADTLAKLLKISATQNMSLRFCVYDLSALILSRVNVSLSASLARDASDEANLGAPSPQIAASEYYITIAKEKRMLQMFGARMKAEVNDRRMITRFTRSVGAFLFQWHLLRRQLGLSSLNYMHEYLMADLSLHISPPQEEKSSTFSRAATNELADSLTMSPQTLQRSQRKEASPEKAEEVWYGVRITQLSSNSVTVDWALDPAKFPQRAKLPDFPHGPSAPMALTHEANLYFTPASHMGLETPVLVLPNLEQSGTFHIDDLDADTLYKITISKENPMGASSDQDDDGDDEKAEQQAKTLEMQARSAAILSYFDNGAPISSPNKDSSTAMEVQSPTSADMTPIASVSNRGDPLRAVMAVDTVLAPYSPASPAGKSLVPFPAMTDLQPHSARGSPSERMLRLKGSGGSANPLKTGGELVVREETSGADKDEVMVFISTECEAPFQFEVDQMSTNLVVNPHSLTLLNQSNKKWSTARANVRLTSGLHRWDVHIDRCVSKNIFIGVSSRDARLDNYVGCDKHGWAFLANKAVWHNKGKTKTYGDLFRSGDTVSVILDLDEGTLSFSLNNKSMGVAVEGLVGPLYPAFSLYNEGDQLTVVKFRSSGSESGGVGSCAAEKILERIETLNSMLCSVDKASKVEKKYTGVPNANNASSAEASTELVVATAQPAPAESVAITEELGTELLQRWELWKRSVPMRSFLVSNDFVTICASDAQCEVLSRGLLKLWQHVTVAKERAVVVGVGQHKLWLRVVATGALCGYTADTLQQLYEKGSIQTIDNYRSYDKNLSCLANQITPYEQSKNSADSVNTNFGFEVSAVAMRDAVLTMQAVWNACDDLVLVEYMNSTSRKYSASPFNLSIVHVVGSSTANNGATGEALQALCAKYTGELVALRALFLIHLNDLALPLLPVVCPYSSAAEEGPFFASVDLLDTVSTEAAINHPTSAIKSMRGILFSQVKREFAQRVAGTSATSVVTVVRPPMSSSALVVASIAGREGLEAASDKLGGRMLHSILHSLGDETRRYAPTEADPFSPTERVRSSPSNFPFLTASESDPPLLLPYQPSSPSTALTHPNSVAGVTPGRSFFKFPTDDSPALTATTASTAVTGYMGIATSSADHLDLEQMLVLEVSEEANVARHIYDAAVAKGVERQLLLDERWKLLCGFQTSYVGQLMSYLEQVAGLNLNSATSALQDNAALNKALRAKGSIYGQFLQLQQGGSAGAWESCLRSSVDGVSQFLWNCDSQSASQRSVPFLVRASKMMPSAGDVPTKLFQWMQIAERNPERVSEWSLFVVFVEEACAQVRRVLDSVFDLHTGLLVATASVCADAAILNMSLQLFHATGVLIGLALRHGVPVYLPLPAPFYSVLSNTALEVAAEETRLAQDVTFALAMAVRTGLVATFPEPALDLFSKVELRAVLSGEQGYGPPSALLLHRHATYESPLCAEDAHVMLFWAAVYELPAKNVQSLLKQLMSTTATPARQHEVLYGSKSGSTAAPFAVHFLPPTAVALLSPDVSEIIIFADRGALSVPRYSNLKVMVDYLVRVSSV